jgi:protein SCO1
VAGVAFGTDGKIREVNLMDAGYRAGFQPLNVLDGTHWERRRLAGLPEGCAAISLEAAKWQAVPGLFRIAAVFLILAGLMFMPAVACGAAAEVGITEKLGGTVALDSVLKDEEGRAVSLRSLIDKPTILTLNFFRCTGICTPLLNGLSDALNQLEMEPGTDFRVVTISFDPRDTPEIARQKQVNYLSEMKRPFPPGAWRFLTGEAQATKAVADSVGFGFQQQGDQFLHAGAIMILTPKGIVSRYIYGISFLPADLQLALQEAAGGKIRPTIARALAFCYSYDPQSRNYVFSITRLTGAITLIFAGALVAFLLLKGRSGKEKETTRD